MDNPKEKVRFGLNPNAHLGPRFPKRIPEPVSAQMQLTEACPNQDREILDKDSEMVRMRMSRSFKCESQEMNKEMGKILRKIV